MYYSKHYSPNSELNLSEAQPRRYSSGHGSTDAILKTKWVEPQWSQCSLGGNGGVREEKGKMQNTEIYTPCLCFPFINAQWGLKESIGWIHPQNPHSQGSL